MSAEYPELPAAERSRLWQMRNRHHDQLLQSGIISTLLNTDSSFTGLNEAPIIRHGMTKEVTESTRFFVQKMNGEKITAHQWLIMKQSDPRAAGILESQWRNADVRSELVLLGRADLLQHGFDLSGMFVGFRSEQLTGESLAFPLSGIDEQGFDVIRIMRDQLDAARRDGSLPSLAESTLTLPYIHMENNVPLL